MDIAQIASEKSAPQIVPRSIGSDADYISKDAYLSPDFAAAENTQLWPRTWQMVCREQDLKAVGDFVTYDIVDETIVVTRSSKDEISAFYNVCQHRGRRLTEGCGRTQHLFCRYHGWRWTLDGKIDNIPERREWPDFDDAAVALKPVRVDSWQGWVFVCMDPDAVPLVDYLAPVTKALAPFRQEGMRYRWRKSVMLNANWKVALEAFMEAYHAQCTHRHMEDFNDSRSVCDTYGIHGKFRDNEKRLPVGFPAPHLDLPAPKDMRDSIARFFDLMDSTLQALVTPHDNRGAQRLMTEVKEGADVMEILTRLDQFQKEEAKAIGVDRPDISYDDARYAGQDWHIFPNMVLLPAPDSFLIYRSRPEGHSLDRCRLDIMVLQRYAPGDEPKTETELVADWHDVKWPKIFEQDFINIADVQMGMKSRGFDGSPTNPVQERLVVNFHRNLKRIVIDGEPVMPVDA